MINKVVLLGNLVKDPELKAIQSKSKYYTRVIIAINRNFKSSTGIKEADFVPVVFWGKKAEILCKYVKKGDSISISGTLELVIMKMKMVIKDIRLKFVQKNLIL